MVTWMSDESFLPPKTSRWTEATFRAVGNFFLTIEVVWKWPTVLHFPLLWVLFPWLCVSTHLNPPEQQTAEIFAFIESLTFADDKLQVHWLAHLAATFVRLHFGLVSVKDIMTQSNGPCCLSVCLPRFKICKRLVMVPVSARSAQRGCKCFCFALSLSLLHHPAWAALTAGSRLSSTHIKLIAHLWLWTSCPGFISFFEHFLLWSSRLFVSRFPGPVL